jgi:hypothetical protein
MWHRCWQQTAATCARRPPRLRCVECVSEWKQTCEGELLVTSSHTHIIPASFRPHPLPHPLHCWFLYLCQMAPPPLAGHAEAGCLNTGEALNTSFPVSFCPSSSSLLAQINVCQTAPPLTGHAEGYLISHEVHTRHSLFHTAPHPLPHPLHCWLK